MNISLTKTLSKFKIFKFLQLKKQEKYLPSPAWATIGLGYFTFVDSKISLVFFIISGSFDNGTATSVIMTSLSGYVDIADQRHSFLALIVKTNVTTSIGTFWGYQILYTSKEQRNPFRL